MKFALILSLLMASSFAFGQEAHDQVSTTTTPQDRILHLQPMAGLGVFNVEGSASSDPFSSFSGGILAEIGRSSLRFQTGVFNFQTDASISGTRVVTVKGFTTPLSIKIPIATNFKVNYVAIPVLGKYVAIGNSQNGVFVKGGAALAIVTSSTSQNLSNGRMVTTSADIMPYDVLPTIGIGFTRQIANDMSAVGEFNYYRGIIDVGQYDDFAVHNQGAIFSLGVIL